jgi:hypothetical protein
MLNRAKFAAAIAAAGMLVVGQSPDTQAATVEPSPASFDFDKVLVGTKSAGISEVFTFDPAGESSTPLVSTPSPIGQFSFDYGGACNSFSCVLAFFFSPNDVGPFVSSGTVRFRFSDNDIRDATVNFTGMGVVPIPGALPLFLTGLGGLAYMGRRRKAAA